MEGEGRGGVGAPCAVIVRDHVVGVRARELLGSVIHLYTEFLLYLGDVVGNN